MKKWIAFLVFICCAAASKAQFNYPATKTVDSTNTYFGVTYKNPYGWLENMKDPAVVTWFKSQANLTNSILNNLSGRDALIAEWKKLDKLQPAHNAGQVYEGGRLFYRKTLPGEKVGKLYYREGFNGAEQLLFDPTTFIKGASLTLESYTPSYDGKKIAIAYSHQGAEVSTIRIMNVDTKTYSPESIFPTAGIGGWSFDNQSLIYAWIRSADNADPNARLNTKAKLHKVGTQQTADLDYFSNGSYPELKIEAKAYPYAFVDKHSKGYIFSGAGTVENELKMYYAPIGQFYAKHIVWKPLCTQSDKLVRSNAVIGDKMYAITYNGAKNYKLVATSLIKPDWAHAEVIAPEKKDQTLEYFAMSKSFLLLVYSDGINNYVSKYNLATKKTSPVKTPFEGTVGVYCVDDKTDNCTMYITSYNKPATEFDYNALTDHFSPGSFNKPAVYPQAYKDLQVTEVQVKGHDGAMIPLSIIYRKGTKLDGKNVCLMDGYGAYGISMTPYFSVRENSLAVKGAVIAIPHVRGGSEKGEAWYKAGYKTTKPNTWKDFISCAEYLIANGYTSANKLAGTGTSAGGILISRAITERPDLFAAAICNVGCANAMRLEFDMNGPVNIPEFGTVKNEKECKALFEMDGVAHVKKGFKYPAVICVGGWNDPRVVVWQPGKFAAALQNASKSGKPVLMKVNYDNGHFTEDKNVTFANFADQYAFIMWQCGHPEFQPKTLAAAK